jgi:hypothetical protein
MSIALFFVAAPICVWATWTGGRHGRVGTAWVAAVGALLLFSALFSAQFAGWLIPAGAIAFAEGDALPAAAIVLTILLTEALYKLYGAILDGATLAILIVVARNAVLALAVFLAINRITSTKRPRAAAISRAAAGS